MSSTYKINNVLVEADPIVQSWKPFDLLTRKHDGEHVRSLFSEYVLNFPVLTTSQYNEWVSRCDNGTAYTIYALSRCLAAYGNTPGGFTIGALTISTKLHFLGSRHSSGIYVYDTSILVYMIRATDITGGG